jgi:hypothetical protein
VRRQMSRRRSQSAASKGTQQRVGADIASQQQQGPSVHACYSLAVGPMSACSMERMRASAFLLSFRR